MASVLAKLFSRGNRSSDRFYADRSRPDRDAKQLARDQRSQCAVQAASSQDQKKKK